MILEYGFFIERRNNVAQATPEQRAVWVRVTLVTIAIIIIIPTTIGHISFFFLETFGGQLYFRSSTSFSSWRLIARNVCLRNIGAFTLYIES